MNQVTGPGWDHGSSRRLRLSERGRSWIVAAMAFGLVLIYLCIWMTYAGIHTYPRYQQMEPGATYTVQGVTYKVIKLTKTSAVTDGDETSTAQPGATYVIAELEITTAKKDPICTPELVADGGRTWKADSDFFERRLPQFCGDSEHPVTPGKPWRFEQIFTIPSKFADRLYGIGIDDETSPAPIKVLTPAQ